MGWRSKAEKAKKDHRPSLKDWACDKLHETFPSYRDEILSKPNLGYESFIPFPKQIKKCSYHLNLGSKNNHNNDMISNSSMIPARIDARVVAPAEFHVEYEAKLVPTVITYIPQGFDLPPPPLSSPPPKSKSPTSKVVDSTELNDNNKSSNEKTIHSWNALSNWHLKTLASDETLRERLFKCGEDDDGKSIKLKLKHFMRYLEKNKDDSPLYVFDSSFEDDKIAKRILDDYRVPAFFNEDLFRLVGEKRRPPYRWFLIGPERSGTCIHIDPLATSAWNTLIVGKKRWVLFPPHVPKSVVKGNKQIYKGEDDEAIHYFTTILPRIKQAAKESGGTGKYKNFECYEFTQYENETVFIPCGWWHADTVGVTQNFCSQRNFDQVWVKTRTGRKKMAFKWLKELEIKYPHLATRALELNLRDGFIMKYDPEEIERRKKEEDKLAKKKKKEAAKEAKKYTDRPCFTSSSNDKTCYNRDAKRSRVERVVSPDNA